MLCEHIRHVGEVLPSMPKSAHVELLGHMHASLVIMEIEMCIDIVKIISDAVDRHLDTLIVFSKDPAFVELTDAANQTKQLAPVKLMTKFKSPAVSSTHRSTRSKPICTFRPLLHRDLLGMPARSPSCRTRSWPR